MCILSVYGTSVSFSKHLFCLPLGKKNTKYSKFHIPSPERRFFELILVNMLLTMDGSFMSSHCPEVSEWATPGKFGYSV